MTRGDIFTEIDGCLQDIDNAAEYMNVPEKARNQILRATDRINHLSCKWLKKESKRLKKKNKKKQGEGQK